VDNLTARHLTISCGNCANTWYDIAYEDRCEDGDLNKYAIYTEMGYVDGCVEQIAAPLEVFVERVGYCKVCEPIKIPFTRTACIVDKLYLFTFNNLVNMDQNCPIVVGVEYVGGEVIVCTVDCCEASSSSSSSACTTETICGTVEWTCTLSSVCVGDPPFCVSYLSWQPTGGWTSDLCPNGVLLLPLTPCTTPGATTDTKCCCCGGSAWAWNVSLGTWKLVSDGCLYGGVTVYPDYDGDYDGEVALTCCCCDGSSASSSSAAALEACCDCSSYPLAWTMTIAGLTGRTSCTSANGDYTLNALSACQWQTPGGGGGQASILLYCDETNYVLNVITTGGNAQYIKSRATWDCLNANTLAFSTSGGLCTDWPATMTVTPA
jgi:hypothetical protein